MRARQGDFRESTCEIPRLSQLQQQREHAALDGIGDGVFASAFTNVAAAGVSGFTSFTSKRDKMAVLRDKLASCSYAHEPHTRCRMAPQVAFRSNGKGDKKEGGGGEGEGKSAGGGRASSTSAGGSEWE